MKKTIYLIYRPFFIFLLLLAFSNRIWAADETFSAGAYIIDMGQSSQTIAKGLKPYGLVYALIVDHQVPVRWVINPNKVKDGTDVTVNSKDYKGGTFIIPSEYINSAVITKINTWKSKGVIVDGPIASSFIAPVYAELTSWPRAVLDDNNDQIIEDYYSDAEIPESSYVLKGNPTMLTGCDDIYVLPHADPQNWDASWKTALDGYIKDQKGYLWAACHAASRLEAPVTTNNNTKGCGFPYLSTNALLTEKQHEDGNGNYTYNPAYDADPVMQFIGKLDAATTNGSEQIYIPTKTTGSWRPSTRVAVYQPTHVEANPNEAAVVVYGPAYGNSDYGMVMYEAGHDHSGNAAANVAAIRAYFNFILLAGIQRQIHINSNIPTLVYSGSTINLTTNITNGGTPPYNYQWSSSCNGGSFSNPNSGSTNYTAPVVGNPTTCVISVLVTDNCGRFSYETEMILLRDPIGPDANDDNTSTILNNPVEIDILANDVEGDLPLGPSSITFVPGTEPNPSTQGTFTKNPSTGIVTFTPVTGFLGTATINYQICDENNLCDVATITVNVINGAVISYPALGFGTLAYEDQWPSVGDYDFNDLVIDYQFETMINTNNYVVKVNGTFIIKSFGATFRNGFGFQLSDAIDPQDLVVSGYEITDNYISLESNGTESGQTSPTIILFDNCYHQMAHPGSGIGVNTDPAAPYVSPKTISIEVLFPPSKYLYNELDISSFNPFLIVGLIRGREVHLPNYAPTELADPSLFGTYQDFSDPGSGRYYLTNTNLPWAINIYESFDYPIEKSQIIDAHLKFGEWATSGGTVYNDWYKDLPGYRNQSQIYQVP